MTISSIGPTTVLLTDVILLGLNSFNGTFMVRPYDSDLAVLEREYGWFRRERNGKPNTLLYGRITGPIHDDVPNPWNKPYGPLVRGDAVARIADTPKNLFDAVEPRLTPPAKIAYFEAIRVRYRPSWEVYLEHRREVQ